MKLNIIKTVFVALLFVLPLNVIGQQRGDRASFEERRKEQAEKLKKDLKLKKKQVEAFDKASASFNKKRTELMQSMRDGTVAREDIREKMMKLNEGYETELKKVLDEKQFKKYKKIMEEQRAYRGQRGQRGQGRTYQGRGGR